MFTSCVLETGKELTEAHPESHEGTSLACRWLHAQTPGAALPCVRHNGLKSQEGAGRVARAPA
jgi:hypothetical protein